MVCKIIQNNSSPTSGRVVTLKTGKREMPGSNPGRACRPSRSEFFSRKYGLDPLERPHGEHSTHRLRSLVRQAPLEPTTNQPFPK